MRVASGPGQQPRRFIDGGVRSWQHRLFAIAAKGALLPISCDQKTYDANLVALPVERTEEFLSFVGQK